MNNLDLLAKLVSIHSEYPNEGEIGRFVYDFFSSKKYKTTVQKVEGDRYNVLVEKGNGSKSVLLYSHLDTVGITEGWRTDPFKLVVQKDKAYGLGAWDMKAGMMVNINAFLHFNPKNIKLKLAFCVDEEYISKGGYRLMRSPFVRNVDCVISTEPAFQHGIRGIVTGRMGRAVYLVKIIGKSKHIAFYAQKEDINIALGEFLTQLKSLYEHENGHEKQFIFARKISSQSVGMSTPQETIVELESSVISPLTHQTILQLLRKMAKKIQTKYNNVKISVAFVRRATPFLDGYEINKNNSFLKELSESVYHVTKRTAFPYFRFSVADENIFGSRGMTVLGIGPEGGNAHAPNEWVSLSSIEKLHNILHNFLTKIDH